MPVSGVVSRNEFARQYYLHVQGLSLAVRKRSTTRLTAATSDQGLRLKVTHGLEVA